MNVEIGTDTEAAQFPEKEYINGISVALQCSSKEYRQWGLCVEG
jgi:hypothetical protein